MNKELIEKLSAIREDLLALQAQIDAKDVKKLVDLMIQKGPTMWPNNYEELWPYMTADQQSRSTWVCGIRGIGEAYLQTSNTGFIRTVSTLLPRVIADLDDLAENLNKANSGTAKIGSASES